MPATKSKKKGSTSPLTFKQLLGRVLKNDRFAVLLKTAVQTGWLTTPEFLTRMSEKEVEQVKEEYKASPHARRASAADLSKALPTVVGPMVEAEKTKGKKTSLTAGNRTLIVDTRLFLTMRKRYPDAIRYLSQLGATTAVIFSEQNTVAVLPVEVVNDE